MKYTGQGEPQRARDPSRRTAAPLNTERVFNRTIQACCLIESGSPDIPRSISAAMVNGIGRVGGKAPGSAWRSRLALGFVPPHQSVHGLLPHTARRRSSPPGFQRAQCGAAADGPIEVDRPETVRAVAGDDPPSEPAVTPVAASDGNRQPVGAVNTSFVEGLGGASVTEVARPDAEELRRSSTMSSYARPVRRSERR